MNKLECHVNPEGKGFLAYVDLGKDENGKRMRPKVRGRTEDEAVAKLEKKLRDMGYVKQTAEAPKLDIIINEFTSIPDFVREYRVNDIIAGVRKQETANGVTNGSRKGKKKGISTRTAENYINVLKRFEEYFRLVMVGDITVTAMNQFFRTMETEKKENGDYRYSQTTLDRMEFVISGMFKRAVKRKWVTFNPFDDVEYRAPESKKVTEDIQGFDPEEMTMVLETLKSNPIIYTPIVIMLNTGMRTQEVLGLQWGDIDFINNQIHIQQAVTIEVEFDDDGNIKSRRSVIGGTKTEKSGRYVGLTPEAKELLLEWREEAPKLTKTKLDNDSFVFGSEMKEGYTYTTFRNKVNRYLARKGMDKVRLHRCRHTVGTLLAAEGREIIQIKRQLGITQDSTVNKYIDKKRNKKIIDGNMQAISRGLSKKEETNTENALVQAILQEAEKLTDSTAKMLINSLAVLVGKG